MQKRSQNRFQKLVQRTKFASYRIPGTQWLHRGKPKVFCIGLNKTGTTSIELALAEFEFRIGNQRRGENLIEDWSRRDFRRILQLCYTADAFQDVPFSLPFTYQALDQTFPNAKFILSVRDSADTWYQSITRFHSKLWGDGENIPTKEDLENATYVYKGRPWITNRLIYDTPESDPYNYEQLIQYYQSHCDNVRSYFKHRPNRLIEVNVAIDHDYSRLCEFLGKTPLRESFPWQNKT